jgi:hypothetical protein
MNIVSDSEGWTQYYNVTINRPCGDSQTFCDIEGLRVVELVSLCLTIDDPHTAINIVPIKPLTTH